MKPWQHLITGVLFGLLAAGAILLIAQPERGVPIILSSPPTPTVTALPQPTPTKKPLQVQIKGQINQPGIYLLDQETRLMDLIELAGGLTKNADDDRVNDVFLLRDGDYFFIPAVGEPIPETARNSPGNNPVDNPDYFEYPLNINTCSQEAFESLPGIGPAKAADIILYREQYGIFTTIDDLLNISGIGPSTLDAIRDYLIVEP